MLRAVEIAAAGTWPEAECRDRITLDYDDRFRRRKRFVAERGLEFLLDLPEAAPARDGDAFVLEDKTYIRVHAAEESLVEVRARDAGALARLAWHLGNRHLPVAVEGDRLLIRDDHVMVDLLRRLGAELRPVKTRFDPEGGAYGQHNIDATQRHGHLHHHHDHSHD